MNLLNFILFLQVFFVPGMIIYWKKEREISKMIVKIIISSTVINLFSFSLILLFRNLIDFKLIFLSTIFSLFLSFLFRNLMRAKKVSIKIEKRNIWFLVFLFFSFFINFALFLYHKSIIGADVGRFGIISHAIFLKGKFETNLKPYDMAEDFFYFPSVILFPPLFEVVGIDAIAFLSFLVFFFSSLYGLPVYLISKRLFNEEVSLASFFFSTFFLNPLINIGFLGVFPYAISIFYFLSLLYFILEKNKDFIAISSSLIGIISFHAYLLVLLFPFLLSLSILNIKSFSFLLERNFWIFLLFFSFFLTPYLFKTYKSFFIPFEIDKKLDIFMFSTFNRNLQLIQKLQFIIFASPIGFNKNIFLFIGFLVFLFALIKNYKKFCFGVKFLLLSFILSFFLIFASFNDMNFARSIWINWFFYSLGFALIFNDNKLNLILLLLIATTKIPPSLFSYFDLHPNYYKGQVPWIIWNSFYEAISFIKYNTPENSTFLIDGGGAGCTGASASYGERIFPLTSRKIFYFSDYCWAKYDENEYRMRVSIYRELSINPSDEKLIKKLKEYNVTHIFIGPTDVALNKNLFYNSSFYKLIYENRDFKIFEVF
jgi:hypothetical protein